MKHAIELFINWTPHPIGVYTVFSNTSEVYEVEACIDKVSPTYWEFAIGIKDSGHSKVICVRGVQGI